jgi:hypothetical protein
MLIRAMDERKPLKDGAAAAAEAPPDPGPAVDPMAQNPW